MSRSLKYVVAVWLLLVAALCGLYSYLQSSAFRHFVEGKISYRLQTPVTLDQNLAVTFGWPLRVTLHGMHIANPDWSTQPDFMRLDTLVVAVYFQDLLEAKLGLDIERVVGGWIKLERGPAGGLNIPHPTPPSRLIHLRGLAGVVVEDVTLAKASGKFAFVRKLQVLEGATKGRVTLVVDASLENQPLHAKLGAPSRRRLKQARSVLGFKVDSLRWGESDLAGQLTLDRSKSAPSMQGTLHARKWVLPSFGIDQARATANKTGNPFPALPIPTFWKALVDSEVDLQVDRLLAGSANITNMHARLRIDNGTLRIAPLRAELSKGLLQAALTVDASKQPPALSLGGDIKHLDLSGVTGSLLAGSGTRGDIDAMFDLRGSGADTRAALGTVNGSLRLVMQNGQLSNVLLDRLAINLGHLLSLQGKGDGGTRIRCLVIEAKAKDGVLTLGQSIADTERLLLVGDGEINLRTGTISVSLNPSSTRLSEVGIPIDIRGPLGHPSGQIDKTATLAKAAQAIVGAVFGMPGKLTDLIGLTDEPGNSGCYATRLKYTQ